MQGPFWAQASRLGHSTSPIWGQRFWTTDTNKQKGNMRTITLEISERLYAGIERLARRWARPGMTHHIEVQAHDLLALGLYNEELHLDLPPLETEFPSPLQPPPPGHTETAPGETEATGGVISPDTVRSGCSVEREAGTEPPGPSASNGVGGQTFPALAYPKGRWS